MFNHCNVLFQQVRLTSHASLCSCYLWRLNQVNTVCPLCANKRENKVYVVETSFISTALPSSSSETEAPEFQQRECGCLREVKSKPSVALGNTIVNCILLIEFEVSEQFTVTAQSSRRHDL